MNNLDAVNNWRTKHGLKEIELDQDLCDVAKKRVVEIQENFSHDGFNACEKCSNGGENLAKGFNNVDEVVEAWPESESHRDIMLKDWKLGCIESSNSYHVLSVGNPRQLVPIGIFIAIIGMEVLLLAYRQWGKRK